MENVLITGASAGLGREFAKRFAAEGSSLVLVARRESRLRELANQLQNDHDVIARTVTADLSTPHGRGAVIDEIERHGVDIDVVVNNAGFGLVGPFDELPLTGQLEMIQTNVVAAVELSRRILPSMRQRGRGSILNIASTAAFQPGPGMAVYFASKAFLLSWSEAIAEELRGSGVTVTCFCPGPTLTEFGAKSGVNGTRLFQLGVHDATDVARHGVRALRRGKVVGINGRVSRCVTVLQRFFPRTVVRRVSAMLMESSQRGPSQ